MTKFICLATFLFLPNVWAQPATVTPPTITEVNFAGGDTAKLTLPLRSSAFVPSRLVPGDTSQQITEAEVKAFAETSYKNACNEAVIRIKQKMEVRVHSSDIPELDRVSTLHTYNPVIAAKCATSVVKSDSAGHHWNEGSIDFEIKKPNPHELADRRLYHVMLPVTLRQGWGGEQKIQALYRQYCEALNQQMGSSAAVYTYCVEPKFEVQCCGNLIATGEFHALVYTYAPPAFVTNQSVDKEIGIATALDWQYLQTVKANAPEKFALGICEPPSYEYAPVMAYQSECYVVQHEYKPTPYEQIRCHADLEVDSQPVSFWAAFADFNGKVGMRLALKSSRFSSNDWREAVFTTTTARVTTLTRADNKATMDFGTLDLNTINSMPSFTVEYRGLENHVPGAPSSITMQCGPVK